MQGDVHCTPAKEPAVQCRRSGKPTTGTQANRTKLVRHIYLHVAWLQCT